MTQLKWMTPDGDGLHEVVTRDASGLAWITLRVLRLAPHTQHSGTTGSEEMAFVPMSGTALLSLASGTLTEMQAVIGGRRDVFSGRTSIAYLPPNTRWTVTAGGAPLVMAIGGAVSDMEGVPSIITPDMQRQERRGAWHWERHIHDMITTVNPVSQRLFVIEVYTPPGHWSSVPPHKHDEERPPTESAAEEIYYYQFSPPQGFGFQRMYTDDRALDEAVVVEHGCATIQPRGYHPVANHPGYQMYYLNIIAGAGRSLIPFDDPAHRWVKDAEAVIRGHHG